MYITVSSNTVLLCLVILLFYKVLDNMSKYRGARFEYDFNFAITSSKRAELKFYLRECKSKAIIYSIATLLSIIFVIVKFY